MRYQQQLLFLLALAYNALAHDPDRIKGLRADNIAKGYDVPSEDCKDTKALLRTCTQLSAELQGFLFHHNVVTYTSFNIRYWL